MWGIVFPVQKMDARNQKQRSQSSLMWIDTWGLVAEFASQVKNYSDKKKLNALLIMFKWRTMCARSWLLPTRG